MVGAYAWGFKERSKVPECRVCIRRTPHPVIVTIRDKKGYIRVLVYSCSTTTTGLGGPPKECRASITSGIESMVFE